MELERTALRAKIPRETAPGLPRSPRSSAFFPTDTRRDPFFPLQPGRRSVPPSLSIYIYIHLSLSCYRSNFPSDVRRDFRESKDPFSSDLKPLVRHERARTFSPLSSFLPSPHAPPFYLFTRGRKQRELFPSAWNRPYF